MPMMPMIPEAAATTASATPSGSDKLSQAGAISRALGGLGGSSAQPMPQVQGPNAMGRRMQQIDMSPIRKIADSLDALKHIPDQKTREDLAYPLMKADYMARNQKGPQNG